MSIGGMGALVRSRRERLGISQKDLARRLEKDDSWVSRLETGAMKQMLSPEELASIAAILDLRESELLKAAGYLGDDPLEDRSLDEASVYTYIEGNDDLTAYQKTVILEALEDARRRRRELEESGIA